jgi:hypothetical protein
MSAESLIVLRICGDPCRAEKIDIDVLPARQPGRCRVVAIGDARRAKVNPFFQPLNKLPTVGWAERSEAQHKPCIGRIVRVGYAGLRTLSPTYGSRFAQALSDTPEI